MSAPTVPAADVRRGPPLSVKLVVTILLLLHFTAILACVLAGGGPFGMKQLCGFFRPYLKFMWLDNAYRFYAPEPGPTEVIWFYLRYEDGSARWYQVPRREDFTLRMPFQRYMSIALHATSKVEAKLVPFKDDASAITVALRENRPKLKYVLDPTGLIYFQSYARFVARKHVEHPVTRSRLAAVDIYGVTYGLRTAFDVRRNLDMYDPRLVHVQTYGSFDTEGRLIDTAGQVTTEQRGIEARPTDELFVDAVQHDLLPLLEANSKHPAGARKSVRVILAEYGIPYPLVQPILKLTEEELDRFFDKPYDRETLLKRYASAVMRNDRDLQKPQSEQIKELEKQDKASPVKTHNEAPRSVQ
jgi:hypothetical protein